MRRGLGASRRPTLSKPPYCTLCRAGPLPTAIRRRVQQVLIKLVTNPIKFTSTGGRVMVRVASGAQHVRLEVSDRGRGIAPDLLPHIFEPYRRVAWSYLPTSVTPERWRDGMRPA